MAKKPATVKTVPAAAALNLTLLASIAAASADPAGYLMTAPADHKPLVDAGFAIINPGITDANGNIATRSTPEGVAELQAKGVAAGPAAGFGSPAASPPAPAAATSAAFKLVSVPIPEKAARGTMTRPETYPFSTMEVGQAFFIPATAEKPQPERSFASTVSSARNRYAQDVVPAQTRKNRKGRDVPVQEFTRDFRIAPIADGAVFGAEFAGKKGAGVWRIK